MSSVRLLSWPLVLLCAVLVLLVFPAAAATATGVAQSATGLDLAGLAILSPLNHSVVPAPNVRLQLDVMVFSAAGPDLERVMRSSLHYQVDGLPAVKCTECWELPWVAGSLCTAWSHMTTAWLARAAAGPRASPGYAQPVPPPPHEKA